MNPQSAGVVAQDIERILEQPLPWQELNGSTVLISGAAGFLAAYMVETLASLNRRGAGIRIVGLVRNLPKAQARLGHLDGAGVELIAQDLARPLGAEVPAAHYIVHAASQASPKFYDVDPVGTLEANVIGTHHLLRHAQAGGCRSFLFFSSGEVYGVPLDAGARLTETDYGYLDPATVRACYGESKRLGETMCVAWHHQHGVPARIVRPFHTYGPGMALDDGRVFADFVADVLAGRDIVVRSDGLARRPFCYLADAAAGFFTVLLKGQSGVAYNVANSRAEISILDLAVLLAGLFPELGLKVQRSMPAPGKGMRSPIARQVPDTRRVGLLGWQASTSLEEGFRRTIEAMRETAGAGSAAVAP